MKRFQSFLTGGAALLGLVGSAYAADVYTPPPDQVVAPTPALGWTGLYVGGFMGGAWGASNVSRPDGPPGPPGFDFNTKPRGVLGGGQIGYNSQTNSFVFGIVGDLSLSAINGEGSKPTGDPGPPASFRTEYDWLSTIRGRAGWLATPDALLYVHGGLAIADIHFHGIGGAGPWASVSQDKIQTGWTLGLGGEWRMKPNVSLFAEYAYMDFGSQTLTPAGPPGSITHDSTLHAVKLGVNLKLK